MTERERERERERDVISGRQKAHNYLIYRIIFKSLSAASAIKDLVILEDSIVKVEKEHFSNLSFARFSSGDDRRINEEVLGHEVLQTRLRLSRRLDQKRVLQLRTQQLTLSPRSTPTHKKIFEKRSRCNQNQKLSFQLKISDKSKDVGTTLSPIFSYGLFSFGLF